MHPAHKFSTDGGKQLLTLELPSLESLQDVDLDISAKEVRLLLPGTCERISISLPPELRDAGVPAAKFSRKRRELTLTWDAVPVVASKAEVESVKEVKKGEAELEADPMPAPKAAPESKAPPAEHEVRPDPAPAEKGAPEPKAPPAERETAAVECWDFMEDEIEDALQKCVVAKLKSIAPLRGARLLPSDFAIEGEAFIKNGSCDFKASVSFKWEMMDAIGGLLGATGTVDVPELSSMLADPTVIVRLDRGGSAQARAAGEWMKQQGASLISECLNGKVLRSSAFKSWDEAAWDETECSKPDDAVVLPMLDNEALTQWAKTWLEEKISNLTVTLFGGSAHATFVAPKISGVVSISNTPTVAGADFNLQLDCPWLITTSVGKKEGILCIPEFTALQGPEESTITAEAAPGKKVSGQLLTGMRQTGVSAMRGLLAQFMTALQLQVKR